jgi:hypothetical protein
LGDTEQPSFRTKSLASLATTAGMLLLPIAYLSIESFGPSSQIEYFSYLFSSNAMNYPIAGLLGAWLGATLYRMGDRRKRFSVWRLATGCVLGSFLGLAAAAVIVLPAMGPAATGYAIFGYVAVVSAAMTPIIGAWLGGIVLFKLTPGDAVRRHFAWLEAGAACILIGWLLLPQFQAFPKDGTPAERDAWAERNVPEYTSLKRTVQKIPVIKESVGNILSIAPDGGTRHTAARDMDGVSMNFTLDVEGDKGSGVLHVNCGVDGDQIYSWEPATWTFNGQAVEITTVANRVTRGG